MEFFKEMKAQNPYFYEEVQVDENNVIKMYFGVMQASGRNTRILVTWLRLTPLIAQICIACL